jgi:hypothetical protein
MFTDVSRHRVGSSSPFEQTKKNAGNWLMREYVDKGVCSD